jgi:hypothetical protein
MPSAYVFGVVTQGGLFGTRPPGSIYHSLIKTKRTGELFGKKFPLHPSKTIAFMPSAYTPGVETQGGLFGTRPPGSPLKTSSPVMMSALTGDAPCLMLFLISYLLGDLRYNIMHLDRKCRLVEFHYL